MTEDERSETEGAAGATNGSSKPTPNSARPDPEVPGIARRRRFTADYKQRIVREAEECLHSPSLSIMGSASAVDAMLKAREFKSGSISARLKEAVEALVITKDVAAWGHDVRLEANAQRHADEGEVPTTEDAQRALDFTEAFGEILFVLPARVKKGRSSGAEAASAP